MVPKGLQALQTKSRRRAHSPYTLVPVGTVYASLLQIVRVYLVEFSILQRNSVSCLRHADKECKFVRQRHVQRVSVLTQSVQVRVLWHLRP